MSADVLLIFLEKFHQIVGFKKFELILFLISKLYSKKNHQLINELLRERIKNDYLE